MTVARTWVMAVVEKSHGSEKEIVKRKELAEFEHKQSVGRKGKRVDN